MPTGNTGPRAGTDYPANFIQSIEWFSTDAESWSYLAGLRWRDAFFCPACCGSEAWLRQRFLYICTDCRRETSVMAGTVFDRSRLTSQQWLYLIWLVAGEKRGVSAKSVQTSLGLGSYKTAWLALHKIRLAMTARARIYSRASWRWMRATSAVSLSAANVGEARAARRSS